MNKYHIVFYVLETDFYSRGVTLEAKDELDALTNWREAYPSGEEEIEEGKFVKKNVFAVIHIMK